jgi:Protein of unknown function DUF262
MMNAQSKQPLIDQLDAERKTVAFDAYDIIVRQLIDMVENKEIDIAPEYQRQFVWDEPRESELIESLLLGIPVPSLYMAVNPSDGVWEVVDGVQRLSTILHFRGLPQHLKKIRKTMPLELQGLTKLSNFNSVKFDDLPVPIKTGFLNRSLRVTVLNDRSDTSVRFDLFERLNTGGVGLHPQEIRNIVYRGDFKNAVQKLSHNSDLRSFLKLPKKGRNSDASADYEEAVLRFFAFKDNYLNFDHSVKEFLNDYMKTRASTELSDVEQKLFEDTFAYLRSEFPGGLTRGRNATPINLFEGVAVGTARALVEGADLIAHGPLPSLVQNNADLRRFTSAGTNSRPMVRGRIELVRNALMT